jgi:arylsulfatase
MTGLDPHEAGIGHMTFKRTGKTPSVMAERLKLPYAYRGWLGEAVPTLPEMLKAAGYGTYMAGKWHVGSSNPDTWPTQRGFDRFYGFLEGTSHYFKPTDLHRGNALIEPVGERYYTTDAFTDEGIQFLREHEATKGSQPFFLYLAYNAPHFPMQAMPEDYRKYRGRFREGWDVLRERIVARQKQLGLIPPNTTLAPRPTESHRLGSRGGPVPAWKSLGPEQQDAMDAIMATHAAMIDRVDQNVGKFTAFLRETGELENTLIFFLSDNGAEAESPPLGDFQAEDLGQYGKGGKKYGRAWATFANTPFREYKHFTHQGGIQTPLIVHWPAGMNTNLHHCIVKHYGFLPDLVETCLDLAGAVRPATMKGRRVPASDGRSLKGLLQGEDGPVHDQPICIEHEGNRVVRDGRWKLVGFFGEPWELYDVEADRSEAHDLAAKEPGQVRRLSRAYDQWAARVGALPWTVACHYSVYPNERPSRRVLYNFDGDSCLSTKAGSQGPVAVNADDVKRLIHEVTYEDSRVDTILVCINAQAMYYPTRTGTMRGALSTPEEKAKWPASEQQRFKNLKAFFDAGTDPYAIMLAESRRRGREALLAFRMNDDHGDDFLRTQFMRDHPDWRLGTERYQGRDALDFGRDEVRDYTARLIEEAVRRYDCDGIELDFNRFPRFFKDGTTDERVAKMNSLVERVRRMLDEVGRERGRRLVLGVRAPSNFGRTPPTPDAARQLGCDVPAWARNGWLDYVAVSEFLFERGDLPIGQWRQAIPGVPVYGGIECTRGSGQKDLSAAEYRRAAARLLKQGADGIYLFNFFTPREGGKEATEPPFAVLRELGVSPVSKP